MLILRTPDNLADDSAYTKTLKEHRQILKNWMNETDDKGQYPETVISLKGVIKQWGERAVNPEYEKAR